MMMAALIQTGHGPLAYFINIVILVVGLIATVALRKVPDAMAADRDFIKSAE